MAAELESSNAMRASKTVTKFNTAILMYASKIYYSRHLTKCDIQEYILHPDSLTPVNSNSSTLFIQ